MGVFSICCKTRYPFFFSSRRRHTRLQGDWSSDVCSSDLLPALARRRGAPALRLHRQVHRRGSRRGGRGHGGALYVRPREPRRRCAGAQGEGDHPLGLGVPFRPRRGAPVRQPLLGPQARRGRGLQVCPEQALARGAHRVPSRALPRRRGARVALPVRAPGVLLRRLARVVALGPGPQPHRRAPRHLGEDREGRRALSRSPDEPRATFFSLTPDRVLEAVEGGGLPCTGRCLPLRAFENRVYEVGLEDERRLVVKFYRPGRWSRAAILDEHAFLADLAAADVPALAPLDLGTGGTLGEIEGIYYAAFPKVRGRTLDELDAESRRRIGRTIGRMHAGGAARDAPHPPRLDVASRIREPGQTLMEGHLIPRALAPRYREVALHIADAVAAPLTATRAQRIHGDLHWGNMLWTSDSPIL